MIGHIGKDKPKSIKIETRKATWTKSSSSMSEFLIIENIEKDVESPLPLTNWFYKLNVTCDNYSLHLITDFNIQQKYSDLSEAIQCQGHQKLIIERRTCDKATTAFEKMYMHMISSKPLSISECIKQNFDLAVRFLLARNIAPDELCKHLHESMTENRNNISKAIGRFLWDTHRTKYQVPDNEPTQVQFQKEKTDLCSSSYSEIQMLTSVPGTIAEKCFQQHSKLTMIYIHPFKRTTMQLCCQINGVIPMGEPHFPKTLNGIDTCIAEGNVRFIAKIKIGDNIGLSSPSGTLGGFVKMHGFNALLTCAHVVYDKETLIAGNKSERHKSKTKVLCFDKCNSDVKVESGYVFNEAFDCNNGNETSVDAAVVILDEENNYVTPKSTRGTMKARYIGLTSGYSESDITFEDYDKDDDNFTEKPHGLSLYFEDLQSHLQNIESECPKPPDIL
ncbi:unnamed protein product [Mytilus edulis]|uniref:Serine protease n=1 Tax=Mytilus edulis TaxID=6550 RepID=A0A8S3PN76_MYTED|nr:unnamed protein product [Mytilus edulis]